MLAQPRSARAAAMTRSPPSGGRSRRRTCPASGGPGCWPCCRCSSGRAGDLDAAEATARQALTIAEDAGDTFAAAHALADLWLTSSVRRDHPPRSATSTGRCGCWATTRPADMRAFALDCPGLHAAEPRPVAGGRAGPAQAREFAPRTGSPDRSTWANAAVLRYWLGQWDDALAELDSDDTEARVATHSCANAGPRCSCTGSTALIAGRREQRAAAGQHLRRAWRCRSRTSPTGRTGTSWSPRTPWRWSSAGRPARRWRGWRGCCRGRDGEMTLTHQWLPDLVRLALAAGDPGAGADRGPGLPGRGGGGDPPGPGRRGQPALPRTARV